MNSIDVKDFQLTLTNFISKYDLPWEVKRLALKEVYDETVQKANAEVLTEAGNRENKIE